MAHRTEIVPLQQIYLDNSNPRHDPIDNEPDVIAYLLAKEQVSNLAKDIAKLGTSPLERFAAIPHPISKNSYVVLEGNRRLCALKLLNDPHKATKDSMRKLFRQLADKMASKPKSIEAVIFSNREEARPWLDRRHGGAQDGIGVRAWTPRQKARFDHAGGGQTNPNVQADLLLRYGLTAGLITQAQQDKINVTTLTRYLSNPLVRNALGLDSGRTLAIHVPQAEFDRAAKRFLRDAVKGPSAGVHSRTNKKEREDYAHRLARENVAATTKLTGSQELNVSTGKAKGTAGVTKSSTRARHNRSPDKRAEIIPSDFVVQINDRVLKRIYDELRDISVMDFPFAGAYLLRAMIEQTVKVYCKDYKITHGPNVDLHIIIGSVADALVAGGALDRQVKALRRMAQNRHDRGSPETLGAYVHGGLIPTSVELNRAYGARGIKEASRLQGFLRCKN